MSKSHCKHWNGTAYDTCGAGLNWRKVTGGGDFGIMTRCPCINGNLPVTCERFEVYTPEELEQIEREWQEHFATMEKEVAYWNKLKRDNERGSRGTCECPRCGRTCEWAIAEYPGELWVRCQVSVVGQSNRILP